MNRSIYILILIFFCLNFWNIKPIGFLSSDTILIATFIYLIAGIIFYPNRSYVFSGKYYTPINWILAGIFLSMIPAYIFYNQSITQSLITYRFQYLMSIPFFLARINPTKVEVLKALKIFSYIYGLFLVFKIAVPSLYVVDIEKEIFINPEDDSVLLAGFTLMTIPLYYTLQQLVTNLTKEGVLYSLYIMAMIFISGNRSTLFPALLLSGYMILKLKSNKKYFVIALAVIIGIYAMSDNIMALIEQTQSNINDTDYNRNKAVIYFIYEACPNIWCAIFGNGYLSAHSTSIMADLMDIGIYNSDLGFVGYWNQFGIIPIIAFLYIYIGAIRKKKIPIYLKLTSIQTLICGLTISYFGNTVQMIFFLIFYYLYNLELLTVTHRIQSKSHVGNSNSRLQK